MATATLTPMGRKRNDPTAVARHKLRHTDGRRIEQEREEARLLREREVVQRIARRKRAGGGFCLLLLDYRYWEAKACGWDVLNPHAGFAVDAAGEACDPEASVVWQWWRGLHYKQRAKIREASRFSRTHG